MGEPRETAVQTKVSPSVCITRQRPGSQEQLKNVPKDVVPAALVGRICRIAVEADSASLLESPSTELTHQFRTKRPRMVTVFHNSGIEHRQSARRHAPSGMLAVVCLSLLLSGCINSQNTRFPTWQAWFPSAENESYERQSPFPDPDLGPDTEAVPRGYDRPRSLERRAAEQRLLQGVPVGPESVPRGVPSGRRDYNKVVR